MDPLESKFTHVDINVQTGEQAVRALTEAEFQRIRLGNWAEGKTDEEVSAEYKSREDIRIAQMQRQREARTAVVESSKRVKSYLSAVPPNEEDSLVRDLARMIDYLFDMLGPSELESE